MCKVTFVLSAVLAMASLAEAQQDASSKQGFFSKKHVDFWRDGSADRKTSASETGETESIWAEPIRMPDGRYTTYVPPRQVLEFLENPTRANALKYLAWQGERMEKMRKAAAMLADVQGEKTAKAEAPITEPVAITYFKKPG